MKATQNNNKTILDYIVLVFKWIFKAIYIVIKYIFKIIFTIFDFIFGIFLLGNNKPKTKDNNDLEDYQKELVKKGEYEPEGFEDNQELEEDDYHYEDK